MLAKKYKIEGRYRVSRVFEKGKRVAGYFFNLWHFERKNADKPQSDLCNRFAAVVPMKLKLKAVKRNRIRRRLYEIIRLSMKNAPYPNQKNYDIVIFAKKADILDAPFRKLALEFKKLSSKI